MNIEEALQAFLCSKRAANKAARTVEWYEQQIRAWLDWMQAGNYGDWLSADRLEQYLEQERNRGQSDNSIDARWRALRAFWNWIKKRRPQLLTGNLPPTEIAERPQIGAKKPREASYSSVLQIIASIGAATWLDYRDRALIQLLLSTGLRVEEATGLKVQHIEISERFVYVAQGKGDKDRIVPFDADFLNSFTAYVYNRPVSAGDWLFLAADGHWRAVGQMTTNGVRQMLRRRCKAAGVPLINPHSIRHLFASKALNDGVSLSAVSAMLGHSSVSFTARVYAKWVKRGLRREYDSHWQTK